MVFTRIYWNTSRRTWALCELNSLKTMATSPVNLISDTGSSCDRKPIESNDVITAVNGITSRKRLSSVSIDCMETKSQRKDECDQDSQSVRKKKVALLLSYCGRGYLGMQKNPGCKTIESEFFDALVKSAVVRPDHIEQPGVKMGYQRAARTDKGVSAAGQVVSLKMSIDENPIAKINTYLPPEIRALGFRRTTKGFDAKKSCNSRTYTYLLPTFALATCDQETQNSFRITGDALARVQEILNKYKGSHNFHNYTSGKKHDDPSARRYIMEFEVGEPIERHGIEYIIIKVRGQSFMLHQIRKMIGLTVAICRGFVPVEAVERSWESAKMDVPKAPGLGLILDKVHYDRYNKKFGCDGMHTPIEWDEHEGEILDFKEKFIYPVIFKAEKEEYSMMQWLSTLHNHSFTESRNHPLELDRLLCHEKVCCQERGCCVCWKRTAKLSELIAVLTVLRI